MRGYPPVRKIVVEIQAVILALILLPAVAAAQAPEPAVPAPIPPALRNAKKIFVSNAGADSGLFPHPFSGDPDRGYNQLFALLKATGQYGLVTDPSQADLVLELRLTAPNGPKDADKTKGASDPLPMFRLVIYQAGTHYVMWALTESVDLAYLQKSHDRNFDEALAALVKDFQNLTGKPSAPPQ
jgi:hypothetical protein